MSVLLSPNPKNGTDLSRAGNDVDVSATLGMSPVRLPYSRMRRPADLEKRFMVAAGLNRATVIIMSGK